MYKGKKIIAIIPARKGSKRIPQKNIKKLAGKPLIYYTINLAQKSRLIDKIVVSTDSEKIAKIANKHGVETPFLRPAKISKDNTSDQPVIKHTLNFLKKNYNENFDYIIYLRPTSPLRKLIDIEKAIKKIHDNKYDLLRSVTKTRGVNHPYWMFKSNNDNLLLPALNGIKLKKFYRSQILPNNFYRLNGLIDVFSHKQIFKSNFILDSDNIGFIEIPEIRSFDIDEKIDFDIVETIMKKKCIK